MTKMYQLTLAPSIDIDFKMTRVFALAVESTKVVLTQAVITASRLGATLILICETRINFLHFQKKGRSFFFQLKQIEGQCYSSEARATKLT